MGDTNYSSGWLERPLCRRYVAVVFSETSPLNLRASRGDPEAICWAFGSLINGECEPLGAWLIRGTLASAMPSVCGALQSRGAEFIRFGVGDFAGTPAFSQTYRHGEFVDSVESAISALAARVRRRHRPQLSTFLRTTAEADRLELAWSEWAKFQGSGLGERYPDVVQLWKDALARFEPIYDLNEQLRGLVRLADRTAAEVRGRLARAILRNGPFTDSAAALDFVALALVREEQRLDRDRATAAASRQACSTTPRAVSMAGALGVPTLA